MPVPHEDFEAIFDTEHNRLNGPSSEHTDLQLLAPLKPFAPIDLNTILACSQEDDGTLLQLMPLASLDLENIIGAQSERHSHFYSHHYHTESQSSAQSSIKHRTGFVSLPPELREEIYETVLADEAEIQGIRSARNERNADGRWFYVVGRRVPPDQPAITRVCRLIRQESLPVWYSVSRFPIQFRVSGWYESPNGPQGTPNYQSIRAAPYYIYPMLRRLELSFLQAHGPPAELDTAHFRFSVDVGKCANSYSVKHTPEVNDEYEIMPGLRVSMSSHKTQQRVARLQRCFESAIARMVGHGSGIGRLSFREFEQIAPQPSWRFWADMPDESDY